MTNLATESRPAWDLGRQRDLATAILANGADGAMATELAGLVLAYHEYRGWRFSEELADRVRIARDVVNAHHAGAITASEYTLALDALMDGADRDGYSAPY
jgi:hypothetical protein